MKEKLKDFEAKMRKTFINLLKESIGRKWDRQFIYYINYIFINV